MDITLKQTERLPIKSKFDSLHHWIVVAPDLDKTLATIPYGEVMVQRQKRLPTEHGKGGVISLDLPNSAGTRLSLSAIDAAASTFERLSLGRQLVSSQVDFRPKRVGICVAGFDAPTALKMAEAIIAALLVCSVALPSFKKRDRAKDQAWLNAIELYGCADRNRFRNTFATAHANGLARYLTALPPNDLTPAKYRRRITTLAKENRWRMEFLDLKALKKKKAGAFLAVAQGSPEQDAGIVKLSYRPKGKIRKGSVVLVGKGICFDTGGVNLKPQKYMLGMHGDMQGSAVALGALIALSRLQVDFPVECWMALATNHIGPMAYKPNDVVIACNGTSIEIIHTDAEGRMVLADTLALAARTRPALIIDFATLTGACVYSLGNSYSGAFTNQTRLIDPIVQAGRDSGERVWPFPMDKDYDEVLKSDIADLKQCAPEGEADHIVAARFLSQFVKDDTPWLHIDLSSGNRKGGLAHIPSDVTGFGIRFTLDLLLDKKVLNRSTK